MATLILKATDKKLETTISKAREINKLKQDGVDPKTKLNINGVVLELGDIRYAMFDDDKDKEISKENANLQSESDYKKTDEDFKKEIASYAKGSLSRKIEFNLKIASFYCYTFTGLWLRDWVDEKRLIELNSLIKKELLVEKLIVNPKLYKTIFKIQDLSTGTDNLANPVYMARQAPLKIMERYLSEVSRVIRTLA